MIKRNSISAVHDALLGSLSNLPSLLAFRFEQSGVNPLGFPGVTARVRLNVASVVQNDAGESGGSVEYLSVPNGTATPLNDGYVNVTAGSRDIELTAQINTLGTGNHSAIIFWRNINGNTSAIPGSTQGTYGQGSTNEPAVVVVPAGQTVTYTVRHTTSANNQRVQPGSFISAREL